MKYSIKIINSNKIYEIYTRNIIKKSWGKARKFNYTLIYVK